MLYILGNTIKLTRGDTAYITVSIENAVNDEYVMSAMDTLTLSIKRRITDVDYILQKTITGENMFHIYPEDTKNLRFGEYKYDIQLVTENGDVFTIVPPSSFVLMEEVTI